MIKVKLYLHFGLAIIAIGLFYRVEVINAAPPVGFDFAKIGNTPYVAGELLVRFAPKASGIQRTKSERNEILLPLGSTAIEHNFKIVPGLSLVKLPDGQTVEQALKIYNKTNGILHAQPNYIVKALATFPNDGRFADLWGMHNAGQEGGTFDADIDAREAWHIATDSDVIVSVIDTGVDYNHPELADNMWVNNAEANGDPNEDIEVLNGWRTLEARL